jgi:hypothetical protein
MQFRSKLHFVVMRSLALLALIAPLTPSQVLATEDSTPYATVGEWSIFYDSSLGGCFMLGSWTSGVIVRLGFDRVAAKSTYIMVGNTAWRSIEIGKQYTMLFQFDGQAPFQGAMTAVTMGNTKVLLAPTATQFMKNFAVKQWLTISYNGRVVTTLSLPRSQLAMASAVQCQQRADAVAAQRDPFAAAPAQPPLNLAPARDPFSGGSNVQGAETF